MNELHYDTMRFLKAADRSTSSHHPSTCRSSASHCEQSPNAGKEGQSKPASFLGLCVEIRVQIYEYLLTPHCTPEDLEEFQKSNHCCAYPKGAGRNSDYYAYDIACDCTNRRLFPQILATNRQIYREAAQVLYEHMELRVRLPTVKYTIQSLPVDTRTYIKRMVIVGSPGEMSERHLDLTGDRARWQFPLQQYFEIIRTAFQNLQYVRLHIDMGEPVPGRSAVMEQFGIVATLPRLVEVVVQVDAAMPPPGMPSWARSMRGVVTSAITRKAASLGKDLLVREIEPYC